MRSRVLVCLSIVSLLLMAGIVYAQEQAEGRIVDKETGKPVPFASIGVVGTSRGTTSNSNGEFSLLLSDPFTVRITCVGYESVTISSRSALALVQLIPETRQLSEIYISTKQVNARRVVQKAFSSITSNYSTEGFLQQFFYRHYCQDDSVYGRLIEASVDVWKHQGYRNMRRTSGDREEIRVTQLRRSLDNTAIAQSHTPISVGNILQADIAGYQTAEKSEHLKFYAEPGNLRTDNEKYSFSFDGYTTYDGEEVYVIRYASRKDSILTTGGYLPVPSAVGVLYITTRDHAFIRVEDTKHESTSTLRTTALYRKYNDKYFPYHFIREGENVAPDGSAHHFHIELMSVEVRKGEQEKFTGREPSRQELLEIPYDSSYWSNHAVLKTTPLEDAIIYDLGGGASLNKQFYLYQEYEANSTDGGNRGEEKFIWMRSFLQGRKMVYLAFWDTTCETCLMELERVKQLHKRYHDSVQFILLSTDQQDVVWKQYVNRYNLFSDGIINYRLGNSSTVAKAYQVRNTPAFVLIARSGEVLDIQAKRPNDPLLEEELNRLLMQKNQ
jgi:thiol-disulfide isomerase/thioredoxin